MSSKYYSISEATRIIKEYARNKSIRNTTHAKKRMAERSITMQDLLCVFRNGRVGKTPELDVKTNRWKYKITGNGIDDNDLTVVVAIDTKSKYIVIITVFWENENEMPALQ